MPYSVIAIRPRSTFGSAEALLGSDLPGFPLSSLSTTRLFDVPLVAFIVDEGGHPKWEATLFLADIAMRSRSITGDTVRTYAEALAGWLTHLDRVRKSMVSATEFDLKTYRNWLIHEPKCSGRGPMSNATVNIRIGTVLRFHLWAKSQESFESPLGVWAQEVQQSRRERYRSEPFRNQNRKSILPLVDRRIPKSLHIHDVAEIIRKAKSPFSLMFRWAVCTGLRRFEILNLECTALNGDEFGCGQGHIALAQIDIRRKGSRVSSIYTTKSLIEETEWYVVTERPKPTPSYENFVFLNSRGKPFDRGQVSRAFHATAEQCGIAASLHHLRHTFAVVTLQVLQNQAAKGAEVNPIKTLQMLLGHACVETTEVYLRTLEVGGEATSEALEFLYGCSL